VVAQNSGCAVHVTREYFIQRGICQHWAEAADERDRCLVHQINIRSSLIATFVSVALGHDGFQ
jgi:hypothetical protein